MAARAPTTDTVKLHNLFCPSLVPHKRTHQPRDIRSEQKGAFGVDFGSRCGHARAAQYGRDDAEMRLVGAHLRVHAWIHAEMLGFTCFSISWMVWL